MKIQHIMNGSTQINPVKKTSHFRYRIKQFVLYSSIMLFPLPVLADREVVANIPNSSIEHAILALSQQAGVKIAFNSIEPSFRITAVNGKVSYEQQIRQWIAGYPLVLTKIGEDQYRLTRIRDDTSQNLLPIAVEGDVFSNASRRVHQDQTTYLADQILSVGGTLSDVMATPRSVAVVTSKELEQRAVTTIEDALAYTAGVQVTAYGLDLRFDQISVRGFSATVDGDYLDGLRQVSSGWLASFHTEPFGLERVEVLKGPSSLEFGQVSPGGAINRVSKLADEHAKHEVSLQLGLDDHYQVALDYNDRILGRDNQFFRIVALAREANTNQIGVNNDSLYLAPSWLWLPSDGSRLTVFAQLNRFATAASPRPADNPDGSLSDYWAGDKDFDGLKQNQLQLGYQWEQKLNDTWNLSQKARYGYLDTDNQYVDADTWLDSTTLSRYGIGVYEKMHTFVVDNALQAKVNIGQSNHHVALGIDYTWMRGRVNYLYGDAPTLDVSNPDYSQVIPDPTMPLSSPKNRADQLGIYITDKAQMGSWFFNTGIRHDQASTRNHERLTGEVTRQDHKATTGNIGLLYKVNDSWSPYISYSTAFSVQLGQDVNGDDFDPAEGKQWELGVKYKPRNDKGLFTASVFTITQSNLLTVDRENPAFNIQTGEQRSRGLELEGVWTPFDALNVKGSYTWQDVEVTKSEKGNEGKQSIGKPKQLISLWGDYKYTDNASVGLGARWVGTSWADSMNTQRNSAYTLYDAAWGYELSDYLPGASIRLNATNLTDKRYLMCDSGYCYRARGRTVLATLTSRW